MAKRLNPYQYLLKDVKEFISKLRYRESKVLWKYPKDKLYDSWSLGELYERTVAAHQLGYEVKLVANDEGLMVMYEKEIPHIPCEWR